MKEKSYLRLFDKLKIFCCASCFVIKLCLRQDDNIQISNLHLVSILYIAQEHLALVSCTGAVKIDEYYSRINKVRV